MNESLRIAIADDEADMRDYFTRCLPRLGHTVVAVAQTGRELLDMCLAERPDLVITDIRMPDMDGIDAARELFRERPVPVILVTANSETDHIPRGEADHVFGYLTKPIKQAELGVAITLAMRRFEQLAPLQ